MAAAYVQDTGGLIEDNIANSAGDSFASLPTIENHVFTGLFSWHSANTGIAGVADNQGQTYNEDKEHIQGSKTAASIYSRKVDASSGTFTVTPDPAPASGMYLGWIAAEFSGLAAASHLDHTGSRGGDPASTDAEVQSGDMSGANSQADMLLFGVCAVVPNGGGNPQDITTPSGWTALLTEQNASLHTAGQVCFKVIAASETSSVQWTHSNALGAGTWAAALATYKAEAAGGDANARLIGGDLVHANVGGRLVQ